MPIIRPHHHNRRRNHNVTTTITTAAITIMPHHKVAGPRHQCHRLVSTTTTTTINVTTTSHSHREFIPGRRDPVFNPQMSILGRLAMGFEPGSFKGGRKFFLFLPPLHFSGCKYIFTVRKMEGYLKVAKK